MTLEPPFHLFILISTVSEALWKAVPKSWAVVAEISLTLGLGPNTWNKYWDLEFDK